MTATTGGTPAGRRTSLLVRMGNEARDSGFVARRIRLAVAIDRLLARLLTGAPGRWVVKGGYANQLRRPDDARFTEDLDIKIDAAIETASELLASGFGVDLRHQLVPTITRCCRARRSSAARLPMAWIAVRMSMIIRDMVECQVAIDSRPPSGRARALASATDGSAARRTP